MNVSPESTPPQPTGAPVQPKESGPSQGELVLSLSHELRSPLNAVIGLSEALLENEGALDPVRTNRYLGLIHASGRRLLSQLNDLFDVMRFDSGRLAHDPQRIDLGKLCLSVADALKPEIKGKKLSTNLPATPALIDADERLLRRALHHVLARAAKVTPVGGEIELTITISATETVIAVRDAGDSAADTLESLLGQSSSGKDISQYTGIELGVILADRVARQHRGRLSVRTNAPTGSTVQLQLPATPTPV